MGTQSFYIEILRYLNRLMMRPIPRTGVGDGQG